VQDAKKTQTQTGEKKKEQKRQTANRRTQEMQGALGAREREQKEEEAERRSEVK
jgi:hypothetical protein